MTPAMLDEPLELIGARIRPDAISRPHYPADCEGEVVRVEVLTGGISLKVVWTDEQVSIENAEDMEVL